MHTSQASWLFDPDLGNSGERPLVIANPLPSLHASSLWPWGDLVLTAVWGRSGQTSMGEGGFV